MARSSAAQTRQRHGSALFSFGFRPFFLFAAAWAVLAMVLWVLMMSGLLELPTHLNPVSWHAHEFLFGYLGAVLAGFLLTAVPNWTGRLPLVGWPLAALLALWAVGRAMMLVSELVPLSLTALIDLAFPVILGGVILREIVAGRNWRNLMVLGLLASFALSNAIFHYEASRGGFAAQGLGLRLGLATAIMMIAVIGGRIIPSFTRNWLVRAGSDIRPVPPMQPFDKAVLSASIVTLLIWVTYPGAGISALCLFGSGILHLVRLLRWQGHHSRSEPLIWILHVSYAFLPLGAFFMGAAILSGGASDTAQHLWMAGAVGTMTMAVMTRATLGHSGQPLAADRATSLIYIFLLFSVAARTGAGVVPQLIEFSAAFWILSYIGFLLVYGRFLLSRPANS